MEGNGVISAGKVGRPLKYTERKEGMMKFTARVQRGLYNDLDILRIIDEKMKFKGKVSMNWYLSHLLMEYAKTRKDEIDVMREVIGEVKR